MNCPLRGGVLLIKNEVQKVSKKYNKNKKIGNMTPYLVRPMTRILPLRAADEM